MKQLALFGGLLFLVSCCAEPVEYKSIQSTEVAGTVIGVSVEADTSGYDRKYFEMRDVIGSTYKYRYCNTDLRIGDSIKFTTPKTDDPADLGSIMHYGKSKSYGKVHKLY